MLTNRLLCSRPLPGSRLCESLSSSLCFHNPPFSSLAHRFSSGWSSLSKAAASSQLTTRASTNTPACVLLSRSLSQTTARRFATSSFSSLPRNELAEDLGEKIIAGDRRSLSRGITLVESTSSQHEDAANYLLLKVYVMFVLAYPSSS